MHSAVAHATRVEQPRGAAETHFNCATARVATQRSRVGKNGWTCHTCGDFTCVTLVRTPAVAGHRSWPRRSALQRRPRSRCRPRAEWRLDAPCDLYASSRANRSERRRARMETSDSSVYRGTKCAGGYFIIVRRRRPKSLLGLGFDRLRHPLMRDTPDRFFIGRSMCQRNNRFYRAANRREIAVRSELAIMDLKVLVRYYAR